jgi:hypothetical protein
MKWLREYLSSVEVTVHIVNKQPYAFQLYNNYPNPFNPSTTIKYSVAEPVRVFIKVYDLLGKEVATLFEGPRQPGNYTLNFDGSKLASGVYMYQMKAGNYIKTKKFVLLK